MQTAASRWQTIKPKAIYFAIGLIAGPLVTSVVGLQVLSGTAREQTRAGVVELQAVICAAQARTEVADTSKLEWTARTDLAKKWAVMPGATTADPAVASTCAGKLAS
jgi:uncharacterized protein YchJ